MVELQWKLKMATPGISATAATSSPPPAPPNSSPQFLHPLPPPSPRFVRDASAVAAYERYLRLPELSSLCTPGDFPDWANEPILKPALQALEITFRFISIALSDPRPYSNRREWKRRLESLAAHQINVIALLCEEEPSSGGSRAPIADLSAPTGVLARERSSQQVWKLSGAANTLVSHTSEASLLPRLVSWARSEDVASKILMQIEGQMCSCPFTLGLGEPNLAGKPSLEYDLIVKPSSLHSLKKSPFGDRLKNQEDQTLFTIHQILECWLLTAKELVRRVGERVGREEFDEAAGDSWLLERIWKLLSELGDLHLLMDPDDFLRLKSQLAIKASPSGAEAFCFRSTALLDVTNLISKDLKHRVPRILGVEVDPNGGPRVQEAAMGLLRSRGRGGAGDGCGRIHLLQAFQAMEAAVKKFFFGYKQLITAVMGSLEANGNRGLGLMVSAAEPSDSLTQMFMDPPYFPSVDAAKTFLGEMWRCQARTPSSNGLD